MESKRLHRIVDSEHFNDTSGFPGKLDQDNGDKDSKTAGEKDVKTTHWSSSISTIAEEMGNVEDSQASHDDKQAVDTPPSVPAGSSTMLEDTGYKKTVDSNRSWNELPKIGETVHNRKHSMNLAIYNINGATKEIAYDPNFNPLFPKLEIFYSANAHSTVTDAYIHARSRLESYVRFTEVYHNSRRYASACYPFKVNVAPTGSSSGYPSFVSGTNYEEIGEIIQLWFSQSLKFLLDKNSFLFSKGIAQYLGKISGVKAEFASTTSVNGEEPDVVKDTLRNADILVIRCSLEEEFTWQLALDEPNWNIVDFFVDISPFCKDSNEEHEHNENSKSSDWTPTSTQSSSSSVAKISTESSSRSSTSESIDEKESSEQLEKLGATSAELFSHKDVATSFSPSVQDCMGRDLKALLKKGNGMASLARKLTQSSPEDARSEKSLKKEKKSHYSKFSKGAASSLGLSNLFKRKASNVDAEKIESFTGISPELNEKINFNIQNSYLEDYYASILGNFSKLVSPTHYVFPKKNLSKLVREREANHERKAKNYEREFLRMKLPLDSDAFPVIMCPDVWVALPFSKWKGFLEEVYRCIIPGGFLQTSTFNFVTTNICNVSGDEKAKLPTTLESKLLAESISLEAVKRGIRVFPMRYLVQTLKDVGFVDVNYTVVSLKRGDLSTNMGMLFEFLALYCYDFQMRAGFLDSDTAPAGTDPASFPLRYVQEHMDGIDDDAGVLRFVFTTARKPMG